VLRVGGDRRAEEEVVDVVEQRPGFDAAAQVADARAALVEDRAERGDLRYAREEAGGAVDDLLERRALVRGAEARDVGELVAPDRAVL
jgi:hypothetical protein